MPKALPGFIACKLPGRSDAEGKQGENDEEDEVRRVEKEMMNAVLTANLVDSSTSGVFFFVEWLRRWVMLKEAPVALWLESLFNM